MKKKINWDAWGIGATLACAIHCALLPLFFSSLPMLGINIIHNRLVEYIMLVIALAIGSYSLSHSKRKHHHSWMPFALFLTGVSLLIIRLTFSMGEVYLLIPAVGCIIGAHWQNYRLCRIHNHAHSDDCNH
jgi:hypothetical protein